MHKYSSNKKYFLNQEIIINKKIPIKSRQWWNKTLELIKKLGLKYFPKDLKTNTKLPLTLLITTNNEIQNLNKKYRNKNKPTDVLSFYLEKDRRKSLNYLGDIVISIEKAAKQANAKRISIENELTELLIHGYLHLNGYDHIKPQEAKKMFKLQNLFLRKILEKIDYSKNKNFK